MRIAARRWRAVCTLPVALLSALFTPAYGCVRDDVTFFYFVHPDKQRPATIDLDKDLNERQVAAAFLADMPLSSSLARLKTGGPELAKAECALKTARHYRCEYLLQYTGAGRIGYAVDFMLSNQGRLTSLSASKILRKKGATTSQTGW